PDAITASAVSARDEIGRAVAEKIRQTSTAKELHKVAEDVLPEIEKFLESPDERRLRRFRAGVIVACIGLGACQSATNELEQNRHSPPSVTENTTHQLKVD